MIAQQQPRSLRAIQTFVARHGDKSRLQHIHSYRQDAGRLRSVQQKRNPGVPAQNRHLLHRLNTAEHIGHMVADHHVSAVSQRLFQLFYHSFRLKERRVQHCQRYVGDSVERPGHGVVLVTGDYHAAARLYQRVDRDIQAMGCVAGKDHIGFVFHAKQSGSRCAAGIIRLFRQPCRLMAAPSRRGHGVDRTRHGPADRRRFFQCGRPGIEIDHGATSLYPMLSCRRMRSGIKCACCRRCCAASLSAASTRTA